MKKRADILTDWPPVRALYNKRTGTYRVTLKKIIYFDLDILDGSRKLSALIKEKASPEKKLRTSALEAIEESSKNSYQLKMNRDDVNRTAKVIAQAFKEEHNVEVNIRCLCLTGSSGPKFFIPIKGLTGWEK